MAAPPKPYGITAQTTRRWVHDGLDVEEVSWRDAVRPADVGVGPETRGRDGAAAGGAGAARPRAVQVFREGEDRADGRGGAIRWSRCTGPTRTKGWRGPTNSRATAIVVMVHDAFAFGSRKVRLADVPADMQGGVKNDTDESPAGVAIYNDWAADHEHIMAKSLFSAGTTWPGVFAVEDRVALDVLCARPDVDPARVGCGGLSGGGLRTVFLAGLDERIKCTVCVGMMTTWRDHVRSRATRTPGCALCRCCRATSIFPRSSGCARRCRRWCMNTRDDPLFTRSEMERADAMLAKVYAASGHPENYRGSWYPGHHQFNRAMQAEAFGWFDRWLG